MGQISSNRIIILILSLVIVLSLVWVKPDSKIVKKKNKLSTSLADFGNWKKLGNSPFDKSIVDALLLDDYVNMRFSSKKRNVSLYIGYYYSTKKVGAAHDPMVCFPGQGWKVSGNNTGQFKLKSGDKINYSRMVGQLGEQKELILYWFQAHDVTNSSTFSQKLTLLWKKLLHKGEGNAFVRITIPLNGKTILEQESTAFDFINAFYPSFKKFVLEE